MKRISATILATAVLLAAAALPSSGQTKEELLGLLDKTISEADRYVSDKLLRIKTIENTLHSRGVSPEKQYEIYGELFDEYQPFNYVKATEVLKEQKSIALTLEDQSKINDILLKEAMLNTAAGEFLEAINTLSQMDTTIFSTEQEIQYCNVQQRFWNDYSEYQKSNDKSMLRKVGYYRDRLLSLAPQGSNISEYITVRKSIDEGNFAQADFINRHSLSKMDPSSHEYANQAYYQARICEALDRREEMENWFIRSAMADIKSATKDNASLFSLASELFNDGDLDHAFHYTQFSLADALSFDAKLRQWQISSILPAIQKGYTENQEMHHRRTRWLLLAVSILALLLLGGLFALLRLYRKQIESNRKIAMMNAQIQENSTALAEFNSKLSQMNKDLTEANAAKEEYIGLFLGMCSKYIDKMKAHQSKVRKMALAGQYDEIIKAASSNESVEEELKEFYDMFDQAFLKLYPKFVEQFNGLLREDSQIELKKGKLLNTELRIFALIRLGITQSSDIASMLRYSSNTIYNYRAQIKNACIGDRETFEERVKQIGN